MLKRTRENLKEVQDFLENSLQVFEGWSIISFENIDGAKPEDVLIQKP